MMNWIYNWYDPKKDVDVEGLSQNITRMFLSGLIGETDIDTSRIEAGPSHVARNVSIWGRQQGS
jgi:hypothetical protein